MKSDERLPNCFNSGDLLSIALEAVERASQILLARFRPPAGSPLERRFKGPGDLVTDADLEADRAISEVLEERDAPGNIFSEESSKDRDNSRVTWLIDPLCGTLPFSTGLPHWGLSVAVGIGRELEVGVLALPTSNELLSAVRGEGAYINGKMLEAQEPPGDLQDGAVAIDGDDRLFLSQRALFEAAGRKYAFGSGAYPLGQLLLGRIHGSVQAGVNVHTAAAVVIARELGIQVTDVAGNEAVWTPHASSGALVIAWPRTHKALLAAVR